MTTSPGPQYVFWSTWFTVLAAAILSRSGSLRSRRCWRRGSVARSPNARSARPDRAVPSSPRGGPLASSYSMLLLSEHDAHRHRLEEPVPDSSQGDTASRQTVIAATPSLLDHCAGIVKQ